MPVTLPDNPSLERMRRAARDLQRAVRSGDPDALAQVGRYHPAGAPADPASFALTAAQLVIARRCGFASWPRLKRYLDVAAPLRRTMPLADGEHESRVGKGRDSGDGGDGGRIRGGDGGAGGRAPGGDGSGRAARAPVDEFCGLACLTYSPVDDPDRWSHAAGLLRRRPEILTDSIWAAAAAADLQAVRRHLDEDPGLARTHGGPYRWTPLMYLAYSRLGIADPARAAGVVECAAALLDAGADPNDGYLWRGMPTPFTVLTGALGGGEQGTARQPAHPAGMTLARLLLQRGADPNDAQALYNRMLGPGADHLRLLAEFGLGGGDGGPWKRRLGDALDAPADLLVQQLAWAIEHRQADRVTVLLGRGADAGRALPAWPCPALAGMQPVAAAWLRGGGRIAALLVDAGGRPVTPTAEQRARSMLLDGSRDDLDPTVVAALRESLADLIHDADRPAAVAAMTGVGFDVNARRGGATALHEAAWRGDIGLVRALLAAGADPGALDDQYRTTPLGWADHARQAETSALLRAATAG